MPARVPFRAFSRFAVRPQASRQTLPVCQKRYLAEEKPAAERPLEHGIYSEGEEKGPNMDQAPHVSEEAAAMSKVKGETGPQVEEQGTPVQEVADGDKDVEKHLPQVMKDQMKEKKNGLSGQRSYSTLARKPCPVIRPTARYFSTSRHMSVSVEQEFALSDRPAWQPAPPQARAQEEEDADEEYDDDDGDFEYEPDDDEMGGVLAQGHKFGMPPNPMPKQSHLRKRYDPIVEQVTNLLMRHGKKAAAQKNMSIIFQHLATTPAPRPSASHPLVLNNVDMKALPLDPPMYLSVAIDSVAPIFRIRSQRGAAGGGVALQIPVPLFQRQRRRTAVMWILDQVDKKKGGTSPFAKRFAEEVVAVVEGRSPVWERRTALHALTIRSRVNINTNQRRR